MSAASRSFSTFVCNAKPNVDKNVDAARKMRALQNRENFVASIAED